MSINSSTPWHKTSYDQFLQERLPQLLAERLPLVGYQIEPTGRATYRVVVTLTSSSNGDIEIEYTNIPRPDEDGSFELNGDPLVVVPIASHEKLDTAEIQCVGEQLFNFVQERLGQAPAELPWDETMARAWLPLDTWLDEFMELDAQKLDTINWLSRHTHLRRIIVAKRNKVIAPGQFGRVCPFELPEGPNIGRVFTVARGAEIRDGKLVVTDASPEAGLGLSASMIPFFEHNDPNRLLMGANMLRQWIVPSNPEPAWVQTGHEPDAPNFWTGRNLLTALISWGADTFDDGIVISESCAQRLNTPYPAEVGDKLSNRHGTKGVVSRILPDDEMPHLPDGTPVELLYNFHGLHVRINFGQLREAVMSRIAQAEGKPALAPPFHAPSQEELRQRLAAAGLPESGMETLTLGKDGPKFQRPSAVGWLYWGRTIHLARGKVRLSVSSQEGQMQRELEHYALREMGAYENLAEYTNTRAIRRQDADALAGRVAAGPIEQAPPPTPMFSDLAKRLQVAGIRAALEADKLSFGFQPPSGDALELARPVPHPWLPEREMTEIGAYPELDEYGPLLEANGRLERMIANQTPERLTQDAQAQLEARAKAFFDALLTPKHLVFSERLLFSGRAVVTPGQGLRLDQVGLADEIVWTLFGPLVIRELKDEEAVRARNERAEQTLDAVLARSWIIINRAPTLTPAALLAFRPVRDPGHVVRLHPLACELLNADFDGDQVAILLPITKGAQREAAERLSIPAHLAHDPKLLEALLPQREALWGLASSSRTAHGREEIARLAGIEVAAPSGFITTLTLAGAMRTVLERDGIEATLAALERLVWRGFEIAKMSGASLSPFVGESRLRPPQPETDAPDLWEAYAEAMVEQILSETDYDSADLGPQLLAVKIRERGIRPFSWLIGPRGPITDVNGETAIVRHSYAEGLTAKEMFACVAGARQKLAGILDRWEQLGQETRNRHRPGGFNVLARARRSKRPGIVFARAAAAGETDPLVDVDGRLLVGLSITNSPI